MGLREKLKQREEKVQASRAASQDNQLPEGVGKFVALGRELKEGRTFIALADPDNFYAFYTHSDGDFATRSTYIKTHTCLHSPKEAGVDFDSFDKPNGTICPTCAAMKHPRKQRTLHFIVPVFDIEYEAVRFLDLKEFHINNIVSDWDKAERGARKFNKDYTLVGDAITIKKSDKTYALESADTDGLDDVIQAAKKFIGMPFDYPSEVNFREVDDIRKLIEDADGERWNKITEAELEIEDGDLPF